MFSVLKDVKNKLLSTSLTFIEGFKLEDQSLFLKSLCKTNAFLLTSRYLYSFNVVYAGSDVFPSSMSTDYHYFSVNLLRS